MGIHYKQTFIHWNYFLAIESDFEKVSRYIEFTEDNHNTYSIELGRIIMAATQEIDGIMKKICEILVPGSKPNNINGYKKIIEAHLPTFSKEQANIPRFGMDSMPWDNWSDKTKNKHPFWWTANNKIKHDRANNLGHANLKNAFNAVGALLITTLHYYKLEWEKKTGKDLGWEELIDDLKPHSSIFILNDFEYSSIFISIDDEL